MPCIPFFFIYLSNCCEFTWLPESLGQLPALKTLKLIECRGLTVLPSWVEQRTTWVSPGLPSFIRALPRWVAQLVALTVLDLSRCYTLRALPESLAQLMVLTTLHLRYCSHLKGAARVAVPTSDADVAGS